MNRLYKLLGATGKMPKPARELGLGVLFTTVGFVAGTFATLICLTT